MGGAARASGIGGIEFFATRGRACRCVRAGTWGSVDSGGNDRVVLAPAVLARVDVASEVGRRAAFDVFQGLAMAEQEFLPEPLPVRRGVEAEDVRHLRHRRMIGRPEIPHQSVDGVHSGYPAKPASVMALAAGYPATEHGSDGAIASPGRWIAAS